MRFLIPTLFYLIYSFSIPAVANLQCNDLFKIDRRINPQLEKAIKAGLRIFDTQTPLQNGYRNAFLHGTSVETVKKMTQKHWSGNPITDYTALAHFSKIFPNASVTHAYRQRETKIDPRDADNLFFGAKMSAQKTYVQRHLQLPESTLKDTALLDILDFITNTTDVVAILEDAFPFAKEQIERVSASSSKDWQDFVDDLKLRRGVLIVIDTAVERFLPVEKDPEIEHAFAIIGTAPGLAFVYMEYN